MKKSGLTQGDRITGKVELWGVELSAIDCTHQTKTKHFCIINSKFKNVILFFLINDVQKIDKCYSRFEIQLFKVWLIYIAIGNLKALKEMESQCYNKDVLNQKFSLNNGQSGKEKEKPDSPYNTIFDPFEDVYIASAS